MSDYSIDDILAELDKKTSSEEKEKPNAAPVSDSDVSKILYNIGSSDNGLVGDVTAILSSSDIDSALAEKEAEENATITNPKYSKAEIDAVLSHADNFAITEDKESLFSAAAELKAEEEKKEAEKAPVVVEKVHIETEEEKQQRLKEEEEKRELLLQKERENSDPDAMLDLVNPIEIKEKVKSEVNAKEDAAPFSKLSSMYEGSTQDLVGEQLKTLPVKPAKKKADTAEVPPVSKKKDKPITAETDVVKTYPLKSDAPQSQLIDKLNKALEEKRTENIKAHRTITLTDIKTKSTMVAHPLNIDYKKKIIETAQTESIPAKENPAVAKEKADELVSAKKHKIKDFVLEDVFSDDDEEENEITENEFEDYDSTGQIWGDLCASHKGLKIRFGMLLVITIFTFLISLMNDFSLFRTLGLNGVFPIFNITESAVGLLYTYLICGILGFVICSTVLSNGLFKLITLKPDSDSLCAVTSVLSLVGGVACLIESQDFRLGHAFVYISCALVSLLFNTIGKLYMITRAKRNFRFISGDSRKYYVETIKDQSAASSFVKGLRSRMPVLAVMRKTEFLSDFLKSSYCDDDMDALSAKLTPAALGLGLFSALFALINPFGIEFEISVGNDNAVIWAISSAVAIMTVASPISILFVINRPLDIASKQLCKNGSAILGYDAAMEFSAVNSVMIDARSLFPPGSVAMVSLKNCQKKDSLSKISIDESIVMAASIAIHNESVLSYMFYDITLGDKDILQKVDGCIYEDNCGITGWIGARRVMFGGRNLMETHHIEVPSMKNERRYCKNETDEVIYLAVGGEIVSMFIVNLMPNPEVKQTLQALVKKKMAIAVKTADSSVTVEKLSDMFDISPAYIKVLPHDMHEQYKECTKYTSRGNGGLSCNGSFSSFADGLLTAKRLVKSFFTSKMILLYTTAFGAFITLIMTVFKQTAFITPTVLTVYNLLAAAAIIVAQKLRKF